MACSSGHCGCEKSQVVPVGWIATAGNGYMLCAESAFGRSSCQAWSRTMELLPHTACWDRNVGCNTEISCGPSKKWLRIPGEAEQVPLTSLQRSCGSLESAWHRCGTMCSEGPSHLAGAWCVARLGTATRRLAVRMGKRSSLFSGFAGSCGEENVSGNKKAEQVLCGLFPGMFQCLRLGRMGAMGVLAATMERGIGVVQFGKRRRRTW
ncbi:uncharacterized protein LOC134140637 isoform X5 [Rhea pennata]|uniref:uncharacterized protein LOC134140637 isoform X5 n=1 Tax=Rhea pennata TaxID=8795 RepID=UPI002E259133